ncbi:hypothetical protein BK742_21565 [Bacillus thuringiensis serovar pingluonsis]|uniref:XpaF1 protein n=1 Tax=Bacillus thuringiensis serovar pingluonsis TaxID=180881 RepID=A0A243B538_BACTU|nr:MULTISPECIES: hypothetical protein [Bacillus cereus group]MEB9685414.1 hypothetical protein [Bacillus anthracis]OPD56220.1 hypothetical protein BVG01_25480 [Bacillus anthracis]OTY39597.1 hypothetical protein BK742_21565 [Bacillus thuringiensis serovar pingluonsis]
MDSSKKFQNDIKQINLELQEIQGNLRNLELRITITEKDIQTIDKQLEKINANTTWILRLILGGILTSILSTVIKSLL